MASLVHQGDLYYAQFYDADRSPARKRIPLKTSEKRTAQRLLARAEDKWALGEYDPWRHGRKHEIFGWEPGPEEDLSTLGKARDAYLESCSHLRPDTQRTYEEVLRLFVDHHGQDQRVANLTPDHITEWLDEDLADATRRKYVKHLGYLFRYLVDKGAMEKDLSKEVPLPSTVKTPPKALTREDQRRLIQVIQAHHQRHVADGRYNTYPHLLLLLRLNPMMGLRVQEILNLKWSGRAPQGETVVDLDAKTARILNTEDFSTKSGEYRVVPLCEEAVDVLRAARRKSPETCRHVYHRDGERLKYSATSHAFCRFRKRAGLPDWVNIHSTRHAYGTRLAESGTPIKVISTFMGHSTTGVTEQYMHVAPEQGHHYVDRAFEE